MDGEKNYWLSVVGKKESGELAGVKGCKARMLF